MKQLARLISSFALLAVAITTLSSCVVYEDGGYRESYRDSGYSAARYPSYRDNRSFIPYEQNRGRFYGHSDPRYGRYDDHRGHDHFRHSSSRWDDHRGHGHHDHYDDHRDDRRHSDSKKDDNLKHHPNSYRIAGGSTGSKKKPKGYHSVSWYKSRGYDVDKLTLKNEKGQTYKKKR